MTKPGIFITTPKGTQLLDEFSEGPLNRKDAWNAWKVFFQRSLPISGRICISCGAKTNQAGELPCGH